jgi:hypothetical protein
LEARDGPGVFLAGWPLGICGAMAGTWANFVFSKPGKLRLDQLVAKASSE